MSCKSDNGDSPLISTPTSTASANVVTGSTVSHLLTLLEDYHSMNPSHPPTEPYPTSLAFSKQVSKGLPCIYNLPTTADSVSNPSNPFCTALSWTRSWLIDTVTSPVEVAVTPDGRADALISILLNDNNIITAAAAAPATESVFLQPATLHMTLAELLDKFSQDPKPNDETGKISPIYYLQSQNNNLSSPSSSTTTTTESPLSPLLPTLPKSIPFATPVLGAPDAVNLWLGTHHSTTSTHRDPYENLYVVLKGRKIFTLYSPPDEICLCATNVRTGRWIYRPGDSEESRGRESIASAFTTELDDTDERIPWIPIDPLRRRSDILAEYPLYAYAQPQRITVEAGQMLYLPAGWFHHVEQECGVWDGDDEDGSMAPCIAVNYWYDQDYEGERYVMRQHIGRLVQQAQEEYQQKGG